MTKYKITEFYALNINVVRSTELPKISNSRLRTKKKGKLKNIICMRGLNYSVE